MFKSSRLFVLSIGNHLDSCKNDVHLLHSLLRPYTNYFYSYFNVDPYIVLTDFLQKNNLQTTDLLIIHFSGHGKNIGIKLDKMYMMSTWLTHDYKHVISYNIDKLLSTLSCRIFLLSDSCHSGTFGDWFTGNCPFIFLGSSSIIGLSSEYNSQMCKVKTNKQNSQTDKNGALVLFFKYLLDNNSFYDITPQIFTDSLNNFYKDHKIYIKYTLKFKNISSL